MLDNQCSPEELNQLIAHLNKKENQAEAEQWIQEQLQTSEKSVVREDLHRRLSARLNKITGEEVTDTPASVVSSPYRWMRYAAAVIILALASVAAVLLVNRSNHQNIADNSSNKKELPTVITPGGNRAVLTLANGQQVILDSASDGSIALQGNTSIIKLQDGQLAYQQSGEPVSEPAGINIITTPRGGQYQVKLPDGSRVWLNAASSLRFPASFTGRSRNVDVSGEAYFEIAPNATMPFTVRANGVEVQVLGTSFNINAYSDEASINTTLLEGGVQVKAGTQVQRLVKGQQASVSPTGAIKLVQHANLDQVVSWKNGFFNFKDADIPAVMRQLARWYDLEVVYEGRIPTRQFQGKMQRDLPLKDVLALLEEAEVHVKMQGKKIIVLQ